MRTSLIPVVLAIALAGATRPLQAQDAPRCKLFCAPVFVAQPGLLVTNAINAETGVSASTHFLARFTTVIPTSIPRTAIAVGLQWTPENKGGTLERLAALDRPRRILVHINNTNPILLEGSPERRAVEAAGIEVGYDGLTLDL